MKETDNIPVNRAPDEEETQQAGAVQPVDLFEIVGSKNRRILTSSGRVISLKNGIPDDALDLYISGRFNFLGLKKGAEVLFSGFSKTKIEKLIAQAPRRKDVNILKKALKV